MVSVSVNLTTATGNTVHSTVYGLACSQFTIYGISNNNKYEGAANTTAQSLLSQLNIPFIRHNWDNAGNALASSATMTGLFPARGASPDWSYFDNFLNNAAKFLKVGTCVQMICAGAPSWLDLTNPSDRTVLGQLIVTIAQHCFAKGFPCYYWEMFNEKDGQDVAVIAACALAVKNALDAYNDGTGNVHHVGGLVDSWLQTGRVTSFSGTLGSKLGFISWHTYPSGSSTSEAPTAHFAAANGWGQDCQNAHNALSPLAPSNTPLALTEYNISWNPPDPDNGTYAAAVLAAIGMRAAINSGTPFQFGAMWEAFGDSYFGVVPLNSAGTAVQNLIRPHGYLLSQCATWMPGAQVSTAGSATDLLVLATTTSTSYSVQLINMGTTAISVALTISGAWLNSYNYWEIGTNFRNTPSTRTGLTSTDLQALTVPPVSVVMVSTLNLDGSGASPAPTNGNIVSVDFATQTGQSISGNLWGVGTEGLNSPGVNDYGAAANAGWQTTYRQQDWRLFRHNTEGTIQHWPGGSAENTTMQNNWINGLPHFWTQASGPLDTTANQQVFGLGSVGDACSPTQAVAIANWFISKGYPIYYWEYANEPDGTDVTTWATNFAAVKAALKGVDSNYQVGAPITASVNGSFMTAAASAGVDFICYHMYLQGTAFASASAMISACISRAKSDVIQARSYFSAGIPIFLGEYSSSWNGNEPMMQQVAGAVFTAMYLFTSLDNDPAKNVQMGAIWTIGQNNNFTIVSNDGTNVRPVGYYLGHSGQVMAGQRVAVTVASNLTNLVVYATVNPPNDWAMQLINYDGNSLPIQLNGMPAGSATYWELSPAQPSTAVSQITLSPGMNLTIPAMGIVTLSSQAGLTPAPPPSPPPGVTPSANGTQVPPFASITGFDGTDWTILANGHIGVNGNDDGQSANVVELAYITSKVWQKNSSNLWWYKTYPSDTWLPGAGTSVDPTIGVPMPPAPPPPVTPPPAPPPVPPPAPPPAAVTRNYFDLPGGDGTSGTAGGPSVWVTSFGGNAVWGVASDADTTDLRHGGSINSPHAGGDVLWYGQASDPLVTFATAADAYQRDSALSVTLHVPTGAYASGPSIGATFGANTLNVYDVLDAPATVWSFVDLNVPSLTGGSVFATFGEYDNATSDHFAEDFETRNFGYGGAAGLLTAYDFDPQRNPNYPRIQHMLRYTHAPRFLKSGSPDGSDTLGAASWPQLKQDPQNVVPYIGSLVAGTTIGIPMSTVMPAGLTAEGQMLFWQLQHYGALWRGTNASTGLQFSATQDVGSTIVANLNKDLPTLVSLLVPLRNQHVGGQSFATSPKNGPGVRVDSGPPILATSSNVPVPQPPVVTPVAPVSPVFTQYWAALMTEFENNADILLGVAVNSGDPQGASGRADTGVLNTPAAPVIGAAAATIKKPS